MWTKPLKVQAIVRTPATRDDWLPERKTEGEGFEPTVGTSPTSVFKTDALNRSATPPVEWVL